MSRRETPSVHRTGFTQLSHDDSPQTRSPKVNIVFVHGLRGHPQTTWEDGQIAADERTLETSSRRHRFRSIFRPQRAAATRASANDDSTQEGRGPSIRPKVFWPHDYLLDDVPEAEVWTYGYNADVIGGLFQANNQNSVSQHGRDLAVKLEREVDNQASRSMRAHSLGGIIVKDAIRRSEPCQSRTKLIIFLGTPHRGSSYAGWGAIASNLVSLAFQDSNKGIVQSLEVNSEALDNIQEEFLRIAHKDGIKVHSFQEARAISGVKGLHGKVVDDYSSKVGLPPAFETVESIDANHMQIARCRNKADPQYRDIVGVLKHFIRSGKLSGQVQDSTSTIHIESERGPSQGDLGVAISNSAASQASRHHYYIPLSRNRRFTGRNSILGELKDKLFVGKECQKLAVVGLGGVGKTQVALQLAYWVMDNQLDYSIFWVPAQSDESFEKAYVEMARRFKIQVKVNEDLKEAVRRYLESEQSEKWLLIVDNADDMEIFFGSSDKPGGIGKYLPERDNGLTLFTTRSREVAIAIAGSDVIDLHEMTIAQAAAYLNQNQMPIKKYLGLLRNTEQNLVNLMSREFYDNTRYQGSQNAVATTWLVSFDHIRRSDPNAAKLLSFVSFIEPKAIPQTILPGPWVEEEMEHAIGVLCGYAFLVRRGHENTFDMHRNRSKWREYLPHAQHALQVTQEYQNVKRFDLFYLIGRCLYEDRRFKEAIIALEKTVQWREQHLSEEDDNLLGPEHALAHAYLGDRRIKEAIEIFEHVVAVRRDRLEEEDSRRLTSEHELARAYLEDRKIKEAIMIFEHVVAIEENTLRKEDESRLISEHELARAYLYNGQIKEAIQILEHVVAVEKVTLPEEYHDRLASEQALAYAYLNDRQTEKAIRILERVVAIEKTALREEDDSRLVSEHTLAKAYLETNQLRKSVEILEHVVAIRRKTLAKDDFERLSSEQTLARAYMQTGRIREAVQLLEDVVAIKKEMLIIEEDKLVSQNLLTEAHSMS
ncbi:hypothetical protein FHL15_002298 [Xylaria flabelliformis]|uniref:NB-ARC domain-containing protein n=1 Tax=Xylaria flabelliformis TaxID=2512241 RepID=A0A553I9Y0_9PEZI|nr:hypothetical protein FHL15_002298 [Xylaria flabelliformis]